MWLRDDYPLLDRLERYAVYDDRAESAAALAAGHGPSTAAAT